MSPSSYQHRFNLNVLGQDAGCWPVLFILGRCGLGITVFERCCRGGIDRFGLSWWFLSFLFLGGTSVGFERDRLFETTYRHVFRTELGLRTGSRKGDCRAYSSLAFVEP